MSVDPPAPAGLSRARKAPSKPPLPRIYRLPLIPAGGLEDAPRHLARAGDLGFDAVLLAPLLRPGPAGDPAAPLDHGALADALGGGPSRDGLTALSRSAADLGLRLLLDLAPERFDAAHPAVAGAPFAFSIARTRWSEGPIDPRRPPNLAAVATARLHDERAAAALTPTIVALLQDLRAAGVGGFRILAPTAAPAKVWRALLDPLRAEDPFFFVLGDSTPSPPPSPTGTAATPGWSRNMRRSARPRPCCRWSPRPHAPCGGPRARPARAPSAAAWPWPGPSEAVF
jgi:hypothetical protein